MASDRGIVQIAVAIIGTAGVLGAAWLSQRPQPQARPQASDVPTEAGLRSDPMKETLRHFSIRFSTNRQGSDYRDFDLPDDSYELCAKACDDDPQCRAFVYTPRGHEGPFARCWLKTTAPPESPVPGFVSGVKLP